jgi:hypothetical protein
LISGMTGWYRVDQALSEIGDVLRGMIAGQPMSGAIAIVTLLTVLVLLIGATTRPGWALAAVVTMLPIEQVLQSTVPVFLGTPWLYNGLVASACLCCLATKPMRGRSFHLLLSGPMFMATAVITLALLSLIWSPQIEPVDRILRESVPPFVVAIFILPAVIDSLDDLRDAARATIATGIICALGVVLNPAAKNVWGRLALDFGTHTGNFLCMSEMGGTMVILAVLIRWPGTTGAVLRAAGALLGAALFFSTGSRGQVIFAGALSLAFFPLAHRIRNVGSFFLNAALLTTLSGLAMLGASLFVQQGSARRWDLAGRDFLLRIEFVQSLLGKWAATPSAWFSGLGLGSFYAYGFGGDYVHNTYIEALGEVGLIAFVLFVLLTALGIAGLLGLFRAASSDPSERNDAALLLALTAYQILLSFKQGSLLGSNLLVMFLLIGHRLPRVIRTAEPEGSGESDGDDLDASADRLGLDHGARPATRGVTPP